MHPCVDQYKCMMMCCLVQAYPYLTSAHGFSILNVYSTQYNDDVMQKCMHYDPIVFNVASDCHSVTAGKLRITQPLADTYCCGCTGFAVTAITDSSLCMWY